MLYAIIWYDYDSGGLETILEGPPDSDFDILQQQYLDSLTERQILEGNEQFVIWLLQQPGWDTPANEEIDLARFSMSYDTRRERILSTFGNQPGKFGARRPKSERCPDKRNHYWKAKIKDDLSRVWRCSFCQEEVEVGNGR